MSSFSTPSAVKRGRSPSTRRTPRASAPARRATATNRRLLGDKVENSTENDLAEVRESLGEPAVVERPDLTRHEKAAIKHCFDQISIERATPAGAKYFRGKTKDIVAHLTGYGASTITRVVAEWKATEGTPSDPATRRAARGRGGILKLRGGAITWLRSKLKLQQQKKVPDWSTITLAAALKDEKGIEVHPSTVGRTLRRLGFSWGTGRAGQDAYHEADWVRRRRAKYVKIRRKMRRRVGAERRPEVFLDESYCHQYHTNVLRWVEAGDERRKQDDGYKVNIVGAVVYTPVDEDGEPQSNAAAGGAGGAADDDVFDSGSDSDEGDAGGDGGNGGDGGDGGGGGVLDSGAWKAKFAEYSLKLWPYLGAAARNQRKKARGRGKSRRPALAAHRPVDAKGYAYHGSMDGDFFMPYFGALCEALLDDVGPSHVFMDNAGYHKAMMVPPPNKGWSRPKLKALLDAHDVDYDDTQSKATLLELAMEIDGVKKYKVVETARDYGHTVTFTPQYHPELNPIEKAWLWTKNVIARESYQRPTLSAVENRCVELLLGEAVTEERLLQARRGTLEYEDHYWASRAADAAVGGEPGEDGDGGGAADGSDGDGGDDDGDGMWHPCAFLAGNFEVQL